MKANIAHIINRLVARFLQPRRGSVLILVVALLVLMALIGTAYLSLTSSERSASQSHIANTQIDIIADGVKNMTVATLVNQTLGSAATTWSNTVNYNTGVTVVYTPSSGKTLTYNSLQTPNLGQEPDTATAYWQQAPANRFYRPATDSQTLCTYNHFDAALTSILSDRLPSLDSGNFPMWQVAPPTLTSNFEAPYATGIGAPTASSYNYTQHSTVYPTFINVPDSTSVSGFTKYPAFSLIPPNGSGAFSGPLYLAGDSDGDGIADTGLFRLPMGLYNGITFYAGIRVIDNNAAVNANIAWSMQGDHNFTGTQAYGFNYFRSNVGLLEMLNPSDTMATLLSYRFSGNTWASNTPWDELNGYWWSARARTDMTFLSQEDVIEHSIARRIKNPSYYNSSSTFYQALSANDSAPLANKFCLADSSYQGLLETDLPSSLCAPTAQTVVYTPDEVGGQASTTARKWFNDNFDFTHVFNSGYIPIRPLLTTWSCQTNAIPQPDMNKLTALNPNLTGTNVAFTHPNAPMLPYSLSAGLGNWYNNNSIDFTAATNVPCKIWINEAPAVAISSSAFTDQTFQDLWRGFWCVMSDTPTNTHYQGAGDTDTNPYDYLINTGSTPGVTAGVPVGVPVGSNNGNRQFRSPIRDMNWPTGAGTVRMDGFNTMLLRAALASINTMEMRDDTATQYNTYNVWQNSTWQNFGPAALANPPATFGSATPPTQIRLGSVHSKQISLKAYVNGTTTPSDVDCTVYSQASNPYITEVYVNTNTSTTPLGINPKGYIAVKLYNPYPYPLPMDDWSLGIINRSAGYGYPTTGLSLTPLTNFSGFNTNTYKTGVLPGTEGTGLRYGNFWSSAPTYTFPVIPPYGWLVLENYNQNTTTAYTSPSTAINYDARYRPTSSGLPATGLQYSLTAPVQAFGTPSTVVGTPYPNTVFWFVPSLHEVVQDLSNVALGTASPIVAKPGGELVLLRPRYGNPHSINANGGVYSNTSTTAYDSYDYYAESLTTLQDMVPVDQFDFTGIGMPGGIIPTTPTPTPVLLHYVRPNPATFWSAATTYAVGQRVTYGAVTYLAKATSIGANPSTDTGTNWGPYAQAPFWKFVYPGRYAAGGWVTFPQTVATPVIGYSRHEGAQVSPMITAALPFTEPGLNVPVNLGGDNPVPIIGTPITGGYYNPFLGIQINAVNFPGMNTFNPTGGVTGVLNQFPFGQFARNGDMLQIPFIGGYRIRTQTMATNTPTQFLELNSLPMDASFADDGDPSDDDPTIPANMGNTESIGRFCPLARESITAVGQVQTYTNGSPSMISDATYRVTPTDTNNFYGGTTTVNGNALPNYICTIVAGTGAGQFQGVVSSTAGVAATSATAATPGTLSFANAFNPALDSTSVYMLSMNPALKRVPFASKLFDYFTCQNPANDYLPNVDPHYYSNCQPATPNMVSQSSDASTANFNNNGNCENAVPVYGQININTAPWPVLNALPMAVMPTGQVNVVANAALAQAIVTYRNRYGPFKTIFDLNNVTDIVNGGTGVNSFRNGWGTLNLSNFSGGTPALAAAFSTNDPGPLQGDFTGGLNPGITPTATGVTTSLGVVSVPGAANGIRQDFIEQFLVLTRISNMITVRSDSYTCYIIVQGWRNPSASTLTTSPIPTPQLVVQRRLAFIVDRSTVIPLATPAYSAPPELSGGVDNVNRLVHWYNVPTN